MSAPKEYTGSDREKLELARDFLIDELTEVLGVTEEELGDRADLALRLIDKVAGTLAYDTHLVDEMEEMDRASRRGTDRGR